MADVEPRPVRWLWRDRIPSGRLSLVVGMPGCGKSFVTCDMAARVSNGADWPDGSPCDRGSVLFITAEDDPRDTIRPRLDAHNADVSHIHLLPSSIVRDKDGRDSDVMFSLHDVAVLENALERLSDCRLIVVDPIGSFLGGRVDSHRDNEVRSVLAPVSMLAEQSGAAVVVVAHRRKSAGGSADDMALGSRAFTGLARAVWHLSRDANDASRRLWLPGKNNLAAEPDGLAFAIAGDPAAVRWEPEPVKMSADDALDRERSFGDGEASATDEAADWLRSELAGGARAAKELKAAARRDGIKPRTLERASQRLGVRRNRDTFNGPWVWSLPDGEHVLAKETRTRQEQTLASTGELGEHGTEADPETGAPDVKTGGPL